MSNAAKTAADVLFVIAEEQHGYFTSKQTADAGYQLGSQAHHVKSGNWVRVERAIYRLTRFPQSSEEQLVIYALWSRNRAGKPEGVYSHQTALSIHDLSDVNPAKLHMTVPSGFRRTAKTPNVLVLHRSSLNVKDVEPRQGFAVTRPLRTVADLATAESTSRDIVEQALIEGRRRGVITAREISELDHNGRFPHWFNELLSAGSWSGSLKPDARGPPGQSPLWHCAQRHHVAFVESYSEEFEPDLGSLRPIVTEVFGKFLDCGTLGRGFARVRCDACAPEYFLAFSCKCGWLCPSCHQRKIMTTAAHLLDHILLPVSHRHCVMPKLVRPTSQ